MALQSGIKMTAPARCPVLPCACTYLSVSRERKVYILTSIHSVVIIWENLCFVSICLATLDKVIFHRARIIYYMMHNVIMRNLFRMLLVSVRKACQASVYVARQQKADGYGCSAGLLYEGADYNITVCSQCFRTSS